MRDAHVKLNSMFKDNFREQGFFGNKWAATKVSKTNNRGRGSILIVTGAMRRSIRSSIRGTSVVFTSNLPYTALHNEGGAYTQNVRAHTRISKKTGRSHVVKAHSRTGFMPQRQFIGNHPKVQQALAEIVYKNLGEYMKNLAAKFNKKR